MHVIEPKRYKKQPVKRRRSTWPWLVLLVLIGGLGFNYFRPLPSPSVSVSIPLPQTQPEPSLDWPNLAGMQASVGASGYGVLASKGAQTPLATASIAKVILALCVLQKQPLAAGQSGPTYTVSDQDVAIYERYVTDNGSLIPVEQGEKLTEYQTLIALMLPSANNIADSLVNWVFGSQAEYQTYATNFLKAHGMGQTVIGEDASGFSETTTSTASDLTRLGLLAQQSPVLMSIAGQSSAELPVVGTVRNYDTILGQNGITGLKTGNNDSNPGGFLFTATSRVGQKDVLLTGAVMGAPDLQTALDASVALVGSLPNGFEQISPISAQQTLGNVQTAWGEKVAIKSKQATLLVRWKATPIYESHRLQNTKTSGTIGSVQVSAGEARIQSDLELARPVAGPSFWWRLTRH